MPHRTTCLMHPGSGQGFEGIANFLFRHTQEARNHTMKVLEDILSRGGTVKVETLPAPPADHTSVQECFGKVLAHEIDNTNAFTGS